MTNRRSKKKTSISSAFENEFALEILKSDRLRITILMGVICSAILFVLVLLAFAFEQFRRAFHSNIKGFLISIAVVAGTSLGCLLIERLIIKGMITQQKKVPLVLQYLSVFIETSIPTSGMIIGSTFEPILTGVPHHLLLIRFRSSIISNDVSGHQEFHDFR